MPSLQASRPMQASYPSEHLTIAAGTAIFHLATNRVVVCYHTRDQTWFLPKGRRNACEETGRAAEREGYEESGFRNRLLKLPLRHRQPDSDEGHVEFTTEPVWTQLLPLSERTQYLLFWYISETIPPECERLYATLYAGGEVKTYRPPVPFPQKYTIEERIAEDVIVDERGRNAIYEPVRHENTGVDEEEALYRAYLLPFEEACDKLKGSIMEDVLRRGYEGILLRQRIEEGRAKGEQGDGAK